MKLCIGVLLLVVGCQAPTEPTPTRPASAITGTRSVALLLFRDATATDTYRSPAGYTDLVFTQGNAILQSWSLGRLRLTGQVFGWFAVPSLATKSKTELLAIAQAAGFAPSAYQIVGWVLSTYTGGVAVIRSGSGDFTVGASEGLGLILHEMLHVMGLGHSNRCLDQAAFPACAVKPYGDHSSVMGDGTFNPDLMSEVPVALHREMLGWIQVRAIDTSGTHVRIPIGSYEVTGDAIKVPRTSREWVYIERRGSGLHVCTLDPTDPTGKSTLWLQNLPFADPVSGLEIRAYANGAELTWSPLDSLADRKKARIKRGG